MSPARFLAAQSVGFILVTMGVILAKQFHFPQTMLLILGTIVLINGLTHGFTSITTHTYGPGLYSSLSIWIPLGLVTLLGFKNGVTRKRYWLCVAIGMSINVLVGVITMRGGRLV